MKKKRKNKVKHKKKRKMEDFTLSMIIPAEHAQKFINLLCYGGNYKEFVDDPENPGEMIANPVTKAVFAAEVHEKVVRDYVRGKKHRYDEEATKAAIEAAAAASNDTSLDEFLEN